MPSFMGDVSTRFNVPAKGMLVSLIVGLIAGLFFVLPSASGAAFGLSSAAVAIIVIFPITVVGIAMLSYRIKHKTEYQQSAVSKTYLGGPVYWFAAIFTIVYGLFTFYQYLTNAAVFAEARFDSRLRIHLHPHHRPLRNLLRVEIYQRPEGRTICEDLFGDTSRIKCDSSVSVRATGVPPSLLYWSSA